MELIVRRLVVKTLSFKLTPASRGWLGDSGHGSPWGGLSRRRNPPFTYATKAGYAFGYNPPYALPTFGCVLMSPRP
jgi:hypothetical protein